MNGFRAVYHLARADYFERSRRSSFLIILGLTVVASYFYLPANSSSTKTLTFTISFAGSADWYRGVYNSAWVGTQVALFATLWLSIIGFYLVKNTLDRDVRTGVGQIIATTPLRKAHYTLGKALSNFAVLGTMVVILALAAGGMQLLRAEDTHIDLWALLSPFVFIMLPAMAVVAALAILFEAVAWLRGTLGNVVYFFLISAVIPITATVNTGPAGDLLGSNFPIQQMQMAVKAAVPGYNGNFDYGTRFGATLFHTFHWGGIQWTREIVLSRLLWVGIAIVITLCAALFFSRFDPAYERQKHATRMVTPEFLLAPEQELPVPPSDQVHLTSLPTQKGTLRWGTVLVSELRLLLKGVPWWWFIGAAALIALCLFLPFAIALGYLFPLAWLWSLPIWSALGSRETRHHTEQLVFSATHPLVRQLPMQWLAGVVIALLTASGMIAHFVIMGDWLGLLALGVGAIFVPALALATGVWTGNSRLFEVAFVVLWYVGCINHLSALDFMGAAGTSVAMRIPLVYGMVAAVLLLLAFVGRKRQLQV
jgi:hypothetical protein